MKQVLIINGSGGVGKDTFVGLLSKYIETQHISIAEIPKKICKAFGWQGKKDEAERKFLSDLKIAIDTYNDANFERIKKIYNDFTKNSSAEILCVDMREKKDIDRAVKEFGAKKVLVTRSSVKHITSNIADKGVFDIEYDFVIQNNGTLQELELRAQEFAKELIELNNPCTDYEHIIYVSHPYQGNKANKIIVENIVKKLAKSSPNILFVSPISAFGFEYDALPYSQGLNQCLWLLSKCTAMLLIGDYKNSAGCKAEIDFCKKHNIPILGGCDD